MPRSAHPIIVTPDVAQLHAFYGGLLGVEVSRRVPDDGPVFYLELRATPSSSGWSPTTPSPSGSRAGSSSALNAPVAGG